MSTTQAWRGIVRRCYGKKFVSASRRIWMDIWCVVNRIKLTWLVDYLPLDAIKMRRLLEDSVSAGVFTIQDHSLAIIMLNSDLLVINTSIQLATPPDTVFIDISTKLDKPVVVSECAWEPVRCAIQEIHRSITSAAKSCAEQMLIMTQLLLAQDVNLSTVFGWLLGYPAVYWFDNSSPNSWNHASVSRLVCYSAIISNAQVTDHKLYSFTIPEKLQDQLDTCIKKWFMQLTDIVCSKECSVKLINKVVNVQQLML